MAVNDLDTQSMVKAVVDLEGMFVSTDKNLSGLEKKIDIQYSHIFNDDDSIKDNLRNPVKVYKRLNEVKEEFSKIKEDVLEIQKMQAEALNNVKVELEKMVTSLSALDNKVLHSEDSVSTEEAHLLKLLDFMAAKTSNQTELSAPDDASTSTNSTRDTPTSTN